MTPPIAPVRPHVLSTHGRERTDSYYWLRERSDPETIAYLEAENSYLNDDLAALKPLRETIVDEFKARIRQTDTSVPYRRNGWLYYTRVEEGRNYPILCRRQDPNSPEQILLDGNAEAEGHAYFGIGSVEVSPDNRLLAYSVDIVGRRFHTVRFRDLVTGEQLPDVIPDISDSLEWAADNRTVFYAKQDPDTLRTDRIFRHVLGAPTDTLVYNETDTTFHVGIGKSKSDKYLLIGSSQTLTTEYRYLPASDPEGEFRVFEPRRRGHEYHVDHIGDSFYIRTNDEAKNFRMMRAPEGATASDNWTEVVAHREDTLLAGFVLFHDFSVLVERSAGLVQLHIRPWSAGPGEHLIHFADPAYAAGLGANYEPDTHTVRFVYSSLSTPHSVYAYDVDSRVSTLLKRDEVLGGFDPANYVVERLHATSHDGVRVPVSLVRRRDVSQPQPLLQYGYGSYGHSIDAGFNAFIVSLLDRGFAYAIAHIRGGQEMGRSWYDDGKLMKKKNTFLDFIAATEHLVASGHADPERVYAMGGSAGGLLMGAVMNMRPDLYHGIVAAVPFVDVVTTMLDETIPLTTFEYDEWGNPNEPAAFEYMLSYSPLDNVEAKQYPNLLVTTGLHDSQVQYWEPAKWVAKLRAVSTGNARVYLHTNMEAGHGGASGRYKRYEEIALQYAFLISLAAAQRQ